MTPRRWTGRFAVRCGIGGVTVLVGTLVLVILPGEIGATGIAWAIGAGLSLLLLKAGMTVMLLALLARLSAGSDRERDRRCTATRYLDERGVPETR